MDDFFVFFWKKKDEGMIDDSSVKRRRSLGTQLRCYFLVVGFHVVHKVTVVLVNRACPATRFSLVLVTVPTRLVREKSNSARAYINIQSYKRL